MVFLQWVEASATKVGQKIKVPAGKAWWTVDFIGVDLVVIRRGSLKKNLTTSERLLQEPFENLAK